MFLRDIKDRYDADDFVPVTIERVTHIQSNKKTNKFIIYVNNTDAFGLLSENYSYISSKALANKLSKEGYLVKHFMYTKGYMLVTLYNPEWPVLDMNDEERELLHYLTNNDNVKKLTDPKSTYRTALYFLNNYSGESRLRIGFSLLIAESISLPLNKLQQSYIHMGNLIEDIKAIKQPDSMLQQLKQQSGYDLLTYLKHIILNKSDIETITGVFEELGIQDPNALQVLTTIAILFPNKIYNIAKNNIDLIY